MKPVFRYQCPFCEWLMSTKAGAKRHLARTHSISRLVSKEEAAEAVRFMDAQAREALKERP